jgi:hypothetical protein
MFLNIKKKTNNATPTLITLIISTLHTHHPSKVKIYKKDTNKFFSFYSAKKQKKSPKKTILTL